MNAFGAKRRTPTIVGLSVILTLLLIDLDSSIPMSALSSIYK